MTATPAYPPSPAATVTVNNYCCEPCKGKDATIKTQRGVLLRVAGELAKGMDDAALQSFVNSMPLDEAASLTDILLTVKTQEGKRAATEELVKLCVAEASSRATAVSTDSGSGRTGQPERVPTSAQVLRLVMAGADPNARVKFTYHGLTPSVLQWCIAERLLLLVNACLQSKLPLHFGDVNFLYESPMDILLLHSIVARIERHPRDSAEWDGALLNRAASKGRLAVVWRIVQDLPAFADQTQRFPLSVEVKEEDWKALGEEQQQYFKPLGEVDDPNEDAAAPADQN